MGNNCWMDKIKSFKTKINQRFHFEIFHGQKQICWLFRPKKACMSVTSLAHVWRFYQIHLFDVSHKNGQVEYCLIPDRCLWLKCCFLSKCSASLIPFLNKNRQEQLNEQSRLKGTSQHGSSGCFVYLQGQEVVVEEEQLLATGSPPREWGKKNICFSVNVKWSRMRRWWW